jgi:hypothetical protein
MHFKQTIKSCQLDRQVFLVTSVAGNLVVCHSFNDCCTQAIGATVSGRPDRATACAAF